MKQAILTFVIISLVTGVLTGCFRKPSKKKSARQTQTSLNPLVKTEGRALVADFDRNGQYEPFFVKGVAYSPIPVGRHPSDWGWGQSEVDGIDNIFDDEKLLRRDFAFLKDMGCNTIRLWKANSTFNKSNNRFPNFMTKRTLDLADEYGIKVIPGFWIDTSLPKCSNYRMIYSAPDFTKESIRAAYIKDFVKFVNQFKSHPAVLFWAIGNENNLHIDSLNFEQMSSLYSLADDMAAAAHQAEGTSFHPVAFVNGDLAEIGEIIYDTLDSNLNHLDIWGANVYRGNSFGNLFNDYAQRSEKPFWISEYGLDSWNSLSYGAPAAGGEDQDTQAQWIGNLWDEIAANKDIVIGATVMEYSDEWWKPDEWISKGGYNSTHDFFGTGPKDFDCNGSIDWYPPAPDNYFHQEWFGIMSVEDRTLEIDNATPKKAYYTLREKFRVN
ncbi:MAG: hypothetical protein JW847_03090 [Candidatus Omnitrophica bacterium]|nr:hypothetical protein [Candidatus Omnitrophota bacterium]